MEHSLSFSFFGSIRPVRIVPEFKEAVRRYLGEKGAKGFLEQASKPGVRMARIAVRATWVDTLDFKTRLPSHTGGVVA